jgi:hypothetical protein
MIIVALVVTAANLRARAGREARKSGSCDGGKQGVLYQAFRHLHFSFSAAYGGNVR